MERGTGRWGTGVGGGTLMCNIYYKHLTMLQVIIIVCSLLLTAHNVQRVSLSLLQVAAEELCALIGQCFQLVYTEATMQYFDRNIREVSRGMSITSSTLQSGLYPYSQRYNMFSVICVITDQLSLSFCVSLIHHRACQYGNYDESF